MFRVSKVLDEIYVSFASSTTSIRDQGLLGEDPLVDFKTSILEKTTIIKTSSPRSGKNSTIVSFL